MNKLTIHESKEISVWCYPKLGIIHHEMHGYCYATPFRRALEAGTAAMREHGARSWLSDDRANGALSPDDEEWGRCVWLPATRAAGWRHWAVVKPQAAVGRLNVARIVTNFRALGIEADFFPDVPAAFSWLYGRRTIAEATHQTPGSGPRVAVPDPSRTSTETFARLDRILGARR